MTVKSGKLRVAALGDLHCGATSGGLFQPLFRKVSEQADVLLLAGDLTDYGLPEEAHVLAEELATLRVPALAVLGNHDHESGKHQDVSSILSGAGVIMLDGDAHEVQGVGFAGTKGFGGGFGAGAMASWGEAAVKAFVQEARDEALKLERALAQLRTEHRIVLLHYAPIQETVEGEPPEIFAFLGSSHMEETLARHPVAAVFHGHAHAGTLRGSTQAGVPVYNVAMPLLRRDFANRPPFYILEVPATS